MANPNPFASLGGGGAPQQSNSDEILALHRLKSSTLIKKHAAEFSANVNVDIRAHNTGQQGNLQTYQTTEMTPVTGQRTLDEVIAAGVASPANPHPDPAAAMAAQEVKDSLQLNQRSRSSRFQNIGTQLEDTFTQIINKAGRRDAISTEITKITRAKETYLNGLLQAKAAAITDVANLYTDDYKIALKTAYGINDRQVAEIQNKHRTSVLAEYDKQINNAKTYMNQMLTDYQKAAKELNDNFYVRRAYEKFILPNLSQAERNALVRVGGEVSIEDMKKALSENIKFKTTAGAGKIGASGSIWKFWDLSGTHFWRNPDGKFNIKVNDLNPQSIRDILLALRAEGKTTANLTLPPETENNKEKLKLIRSMFAKEAANLGMNVPGHTFTLKETEEIQHIRNSQQRIQEMRTTRENRENLSAVMFDVTERFTKKINQQQGALQSLSNEFKALNAADPAAAGNAIVTKADSFAARLPALQNELARLEANAATPRGVLTAKQAEVRNIAALQIAKLQRELAGIPVADAAARAAKQAEIDAVRALPAAAGLGNPGAQEVKNRVLLAQYQEIKKHSTELSSGVSDGLLALNALRMDIDPMFDKLDRDQQQNIIDVLNRAYLTVNAGVDAGEALHTGPAGTTIKDLIDARVNPNPAALGPGANDPGADDLRHASTAIGRQNNVFQSQKDMANQERDAQDFILEQHQNAFPTPHA